MQVQTTLDAIVDSVRKADGLTGEIAAASGEQAGSVQQSNQAVADVERVTMTNAATADEVAAASAEVTGRANELLRLAHGLVGSHHDRAELPVARAGLA